MDVMLFFCAGQNDQEVDGSIEICGLTGTTPKRLDVCLSTPNGNYDWEHDDDKPLEWGYTIPDKPNS